MFKNKTYIMFMILFLFIISFFIFINVKGKNSIGIKSIKANSEILSNKKIEWGIKRGKDNSQPDVGVENRRLLDKYDGIYLGSNDKKNVYLTFDLGYEAGYTKKILDVLKENDVKAAFFVTGHYFNKEKELLNRMIEEGHIIGNHTVNHPSMPDIDDEKLKKEIMDLHTAIFEEMGYEMKYIRPPKGEYSEKTLDLSKKLGYITAMWSFAYDDWDESKQRKIWLWKS